MHKIYDLFHVHLIVLCRKTNLNKVDDAPRHHAYYILQILIHIEFLGINQRQCRVTQLIDTIRRIFN
jgi:hypothetical protein